jgi:O-antigen/teichoic acid export membrane protein
LGAAPILAALFPDGPASSTYAALAFVPLVRGAVHLDSRRHDRQLRHARTAVIETGATLAMLAAIAPALALFGDHRAMAVVLVAAALAQTILSHGVATRAYRATLSWFSLARIRRFGAPLAANSVLLFLTFYADRLIVAASFDLATLAIYGVTLQLALLPAQIVGRAAATLLLPRLRRAISTGEIERATRAAMTSHLAIAAVFAVGFTMLAPHAIAAVYGPAFRPDVPLAAMLGLAAAFRIVRTPLSQLAVAAGRTGDPARANLLRALALGPALFAAWAGLPIAGIAAAAVMGEAAAPWRAVVLARPWISVPSTREVPA